MLRSSLVAAMLLALVLMGCRCRPPDTVNPPGPEALPHDVFDFFRAAAKRDDPFGAYDCLSDSTRDQVSESDFVTGWELYSEYFALFAEAEMGEGREVAEGIVADVSLLGMTESFLWVRDAAGWRLEIPSRYGTRPLRELMDEIKARAIKRGKVEKKTRPERRGG